MAEGGDKGGDTERNPIDELVEMFVYAPIGMLYEYDEVIPKLVKRGKSQVQLARLLGRMAVSDTGQDVVGKVAGGVASSLARQITDIGAAIGLAPPADDAGSDDSPPPPPAPAPPAIENETPSGDAEPEAEPEADDEPVQLPIAGYDDLTAKEIVGLLEDLTADQRDRIRAHELANRARKTVLGKLDRLDA